MTFENVRRSDTGRTRSLIQLTDAAARSAICNSGTNQVIYDLRQKGFGLRVTKAGAKSFVLNYVIAGRERRMTIGRFPEWSTAAARAEAARLRRLVDAGNDPLGARNSARSAPTIADLWDNYRKEVSSKKAASTQRNETSVWERLILPAIGATKVEKLTYADCARLHSRVSLMAPVQANRLLAMLRHALNNAIRWGWIERNPAIGVGRNAERGRERYLSQDEMRRFVEALNARLDRTSAQALKFILLTGCRRGEALGARWDQFDLSAGIWTKPAAQTKQRRIRRVPLSAAAVDVLQRAKGRSPTIVFPSRIGEPLVEIKKIFAAICRAADVGSLRIHDLRHTFASYLASDGVDLATVAKLLGHSQISTTLRYAHLFDDHLRAATGVMASAVERGERVR